MKNLALPLVLLLMLPLSSFAQDSGEAQANPNIIKVNPIGFAFGVFNLSYERAISNSSSLQFGGLFYQSLLGTDVNGFGLRASYRYYITNATRPSPEGFYTGLTTSYNNLTEDATDEEVSAFGIGLLLGYQWVWNSGVALDLGIGPTYLIDTGSSDTAEFESGITPNVVIALGYNF